jgi:hypothetical protein
MVLGQYVMISTFDPFYFSLDITFKFKIYLGAFDLMYIRKNFRYEPRSRMCSFDEKYKR